MKRIRIGAIAVALLLAKSINTTSAQEAPPVRQDLVALAGDFLRTFFPRLNGKGHGLIVEGVSNFDTGDPMYGFEADIGDGDKHAVLGQFGGCQGAIIPPKPNSPEQTAPLLSKRPSEIPEWVKDCPPPGPVHPRQYLSSFFQYSKSGILASFSADGAGVGEQKKAAQVEAAALAHPELPEKEIIAALKAAGALYGPNDRDAFIRSLPISSLERFLGKLEILSVNYRPLSEGRYELNIWPDWTVRAKATLKDGSTVTYEMQFEPFHGDLWSIQDQGLRPDRGPSTPANK